MKRDLISLENYSSNEIQEILKSTGELKANVWGQTDILKHKTMALVFQKPSNRTRVSFEVGIVQLGGYCLYLGPDEISLGVRESTADVSKTLSRYLDGIVARTFNHQDIVELSQTATIPIINGLSDRFHPCQAMADLFSVQEKFGSFEGLTMAYVGDGNNVCHSLMLGCAKAGLDLNIATPKGYEPDQDIIDLAKNLSQESNTKLQLLQDPKEAVKDVNVIYTDVWVSMGQEKEGDQRLIDFQPFQINKALVSLAKDDYIFMHCLPAHRGQEVTDEMIDSPNSIVFDQAENRLHVQKAILKFIYSS